MRITKWAKSIGIEVTPFDAVSAPAAGTMVFRVKDIFTTRDGSWEPSNKPGSIERWARDEYLLSSFDDAGADHHLFGRVNIGDGYNGLAKIHFWTFTDNANHTNQSVKRHSGWGNIALYPGSSFVPERGERGPWAWRPDQPWADIVTGGGLPKNEHWSFFVVWEMVEYQPDVVTPPDPPIEPPIEPPTGDLAKQVAANTAAIKQLQAWARSFEGDM